MLYPRIAKLNGKEVLVDDTQMCAYREHMTQSHRMLFLSGIIGLKCPGCGVGETDSHNLLMALDTLSHDPIYIVITSPGGDLDSTFLFYDTMKMIQSPVITIGRYCASAAALLLTAGVKRYLFPHAKTMLHLPSTILQGDTHDLTIAHNQMIKYQDNIIKILTDNGVKLSPEKIFSDIDRSFWLEPQEAIDYGLANEIMTPQIWRDIKGE